MGTWNSSPLLLSRNWSKFLETPEAQGTWLSARWRSQVLRLGSGEWGVGSGTQWLPISKMDFITVLKSGMRLGLVILHYIIWEFKITTETEKTHLITQRYHFSSPGKTLIHWVINITPEIWCTIWTWGLVDHQPWGKRAAYMGLLDKISSDSQAA